ncbi:MAG: hypothetical protein ABR905_12270 [Terracidiphilus sp.]
MKAKFSLVFSALCICFFAGITQASGQKLYPVQGPAVTQTPPLVLTAKIKKGMVSEQISSFLANGEELQGKFANVTATSMNSKVLGAPASYPPQPNLAFAWDAIYGQGFYLSHVLGETIGQGVFTSNQGTVLQVEIVSENFGKFSQAYRQFGVAVDNKGNVYKMVW